MTTLNNDELRKQLFDRTERIIAGGKAVWYTLKGGTTRYSEHEAMELVSLIATHDQQLLEAILERVNRGTYIDPNLTAGENVAKFRGEVVEHIKSVFEKEGE